jgi:hypothetical protein
MQESWILLVSLSWILFVGCFNILDYSHYADYLAYRQEGLIGLEDFRTAQNPPLHLRDRKMEIGSIKLTVEEVLLNPLWPNKWPYSFEDFRPLDYTRDEPFNTALQYSYSQRLIESDRVAILPAFLDLPIKRHFIYPKDKIAFSGKLILFFFLL